MTETTALKIHQALAEAMRQVSHLGKTQQNTHQNYKFRGIDDVMNAVGPVFRDLGIVVLPETMSLEVNQVNYGAGNRLAQHARVIVKYTFVGPDGDMLSAVAPGESMDSGDKSVSKAMSVAFRTALLQTLVLPTDEPDPDESTFEVSSPSERSPKPRKPAKAKKVESPALQAARAAADRLGDAARTVVPSIIEEVTGEQAKLADLTEAQLADVTSLILGAVAGEETRRAAAREKAFEAAERGLMEDTYLS